MKPAVVTRSTLIDGWAKNGDVARAQHVLERMGAAGVEPNVVTWSTLVVSWANKKGDMVRAQDVAERMEAALVPRWTRPW